MHSNRAGSGAWAIHAARDYPNAEVIAIDISPLPERWVLHALLGIPSPRPSSDPGELIILQSAPEERAIFANGRLSTFAIRARVL